ncbi:hypothetical protein FNW07_11470 [Flavobacterium sp. GT3R68]|nr:hypothetical protein EKL32_24220 [Flavobacterium sp. GSN2]TRW90197.1 hypothetical protein FNW07_11470 [Flavobacterium sp. GT3R68]
MMENNKRLFGIVVTVAVLLMIPLLGMLFSDQVNWGVEDFVAAGILLLGTGLACEAVMRTVKTRQNRLILCGVILIALALIWIELAVGLFGTRFAGS